MSASAAQVERGFASVVGGSRVTMEPAACEAFSVDGVVPKSVVYPASAGEVSEALRHAVTDDLGVIPCRNLTKIGVGMPPRRFDVALSLKDMNRVWYYEPDDLVVSVEPGMKFGDLQHFLARHNLWIPLDPTGGERASVGGILAANAAGSLRLRYGGPRDMVLGMKIATPDGQIVSTGGRVVKNVAGYDLAKLLIGSFGTLGVIVEATLKLFPQVVNRTTWVIGPVTLTAAREIRREIVRSPLSPLRMVLLNLAAQRVVDCELANAGGGARPESRYTILVEAGGSERVVGRYHADLGALAAKQETSLAVVESDRATTCWERIASFGLAAADDGQIPLAVKAALPFAAAEEFLETAERAADAERYETAGLVQMGVGMVELGLRPRGQSQDVPALRSDLVDGLRRALSGLGGVLTITRYPAAFKSKVGVWGPAGDDLEMMRKLKAVWDPKNTLSPGRFIGRL